MTFLEEVPLLEIHPTIIQEPVFCMMYHALVKAILNIMRLELIRMKMLFRYQYMNPREFGLF